jgi:hypothetical protein
VADIRDRLSCDRNPRKPIPNGRAALESGAARGPSPTDERLDQT